MTNEELCEKVRNGDTAALNALWEQTDRLFYLTNKQTRRSHSGFATGCF